MSERRFTMKQINEAAERAVAGVSAVLGDDPKFVNMVRNVTHMLKKTLDALPTPEEESFERKVWCNKDVKEISHSGASWYFSPEGKAHAAYPHALTVTYRDGHHD